MPFNLPIERLFEGKPLISPSEHWWESGVTFNSAALYLEPTPANVPTIKGLLGEDAMERYPDGVVALHYRARPKVDPGHAWTRSYVGLSVHEPDLTPIKRFEHPVVEPGGSECDVDHLGAEDPRITFLDGAYWMVYCGVMLLNHPDQPEAWLGSVSIARSEDLLNWDKCGAALGTGDAFGRVVDGALVPAETSNKDGVLFPDRVDGKVYLLHRPMRGDSSTWATTLAVADRPQGPFTDLGGIHGAMTSPEYVKSWPGAGSVPIKIGDGRYLSIEHTGNYLEGERRKYVLDAFLYDFNQFDGVNPETLMVARMDDIMRPETDFEVHGPFPDSVANVVFACGSYVYDGWLYLVYGGGDSYILAARLRFDTLVNELEALANA